MFGMIKMIPIFLVFAMAGYGYHTVVVSKKDAEIARLQGALDVQVRNNEQLQIAQETHQQTIDRLQKEAEAERERIATLTSRNAELQQDKDNYLRIFSDHDITRLSRAKPGMMEKRINNGTKEVFRQMEEDTRHDDS